MKARLPAQSHLSNRQKACLREAAAQELQKQEETRMRRIFKLMCVSLHEAYGFGHDRLCNVINTISQLSSEYDHDEVFWEHVDRVVIRELGIEFEKEEIDGVIT